MIPAHACHAWRGRTVWGRELFAELITGRRARHQLEKRYYHRAGRLVWARLAVAAVRNAAGAFRHSISMVEDITTPRAAAARFRALVQHATDVIAVLDATGVTRYVSPAVAVVLGYAPAALVGTDAFALLHPDDVARARGLLAQLLRIPGGSVTAEVRVRHADGSWRTVEATATNLLAEPAVGGLVVNYRDISERRALEAALRHQATHDPLTDLPNRALFQECLVRALAARKGDTQVALLFLDLDGFKAVNDCLGHAAGDALLVAVGQRLRACVRPEDTVTRHGGDEFTILLEGVRDTGEAVVVTERIRAALATPYRVAEQDVVVSASIGVVLGTPEQTSAADLLRDADATMYRAKGAFRRA